MRLVILMPLKDKITKLLTYVHNKYVSSQVSLPKQINVQMQNNKTVK